MISIDRVAGVAQALHMEHQRGRYIIRYQRAARDPGTLLPCFDSDNLGDATRELKAAYRAMTRNCRYWIEDTFAAGSELSRASDVVS